MRDLQYNIKCYRLSEETIKKLEKLKIESDLSYNKLFEYLIELVE